MLLDQPIIFYCPDYERYLEQRTMIYNYNEVVPTEISHDFSHFSQALAQSFQGIPSLELKNYQRSKKFFHTHPQGGNSQRVVAMFLASIGKNNA